MNTSCFVVCGLPLYEEDGKLMDTLAAHFKQPANGGVDVLNMMRGPIGTALLLISDKGDARKWMFEKKHRLDSLGPCSNIPISVEQLTPEFEQTVMRQMTEGLGLHTRYWEQVPRGPAYEMCHEPRGLAVIINNINFSKGGHTTRTGAEKDTERLRELFEGLKFTVRCYKDMTFMAMMTTLQHVGEEDHSNFDCFVCCVMSHGSQGKVYSSDDFSIELSQLLKPFNAKECPTLLGKPKLFFIQACQGVHVQERMCVDCPSDVTPVLQVSQEADFFVGLPTVPGCVARRDDDGAPYIYHLTNVFREFGEIYDLSTMMTMVAKKMDPIGVSSNYSTLRKSVYFNPE
ncbi:caspase-3-like [Branchiostoma floridae x Branchiostoma japonicum]